VGKKVPVVKLGHRPEIRKYTHFNAAKSKQDGEGESISFAPEIFDRFHWLFSCGPITKEQHGSHQNTRAVRRGFAL
jgi:hypothetical protein